MLFLKRSIFYIYIKVFSQYIFVRKNLLYFSTCWLPAQQFQPFVHVFASILSVFRLSVFIIVPVLFYALILWLATKKDVNLFLRCNTKKYGKLFYFDVTVKFCSLFKWTEWRALLLKIYINFVTFYSSLTFSW